MLDLFIKLLDKLTEFAKVRSEDREKFIDRYVEPIYQDAETIYKDYSNLLRSIRSKVESEHKVEPILKYLEEKRQAHLPTRTKVRALLKKRLQEKEITQFERGIWGLMMGSVTAFDEGHYSLEPVSWGDHTLLDIANRMIKRGVKDITPSERLHMLDFIDRQICGINGAWKEVVDGYAELRSLAIPKFKITEK